MYDMNEYVNAQAGTLHRGNRRGWVAVAAGVVSVLAVLLLIAAACKVRSDSVAGDAGVSVTETPSESSDGSGDGSGDESGGSGGQQSGLGGPGGDAGGGEGGAPGGGPGGGNPGGNPGGGNSGGNSGGGNSGGNSGGGDSGGDSGGDDSGEDPGPEPEPLSIGAALDTVLPGGQCFASGTISVSGGAYPVTVHYQWRRTALVDGQLTYLAVSPVRNITFDAPGSQSIQVNNIPPNGQNIWFAVTGPKNLNSDWVSYDTCGGGADDFSP